MRALWIDRGNDFDYTRGQKHGITDPYYDVRDPRLNLIYLNYVRSRGVHPGLYACSQPDNWTDPPGLSGPDWADWVYEKVQKVIAPGTSGSYPKVCLNCETHDPDWIVSMLKRWRKRSPKRETYWALEGRQGGIFSPAHVAAINACNVGVVPEFFLGDMTPHGAGVVLDLMVAGFAPERLYGFFDAAVLPYGWGRGFAFTQGRLPA